MFRERVLSLDDHMTVLRPVVESVFGVGESNLDSEQCLQHVLDKQTNYSLLLTSIIRKIGSSEEKRRCDVMEQAYDQFHLNYNGKEMMRLQQAGRYFPAVFKVATNIKERILSYTGAFKHILFNQFFIPPNEILLDYTERGSLVIAFQIPIAYFQSLVLAPLRASAVTSLKNENIYFMKFAEHEVCLDR
jgi:hypothetical protein